MPRSREDIIAGIENIVDKYPEVTPTGVPKVKRKIIKPVEMFPDVTTNPLRIHSTTGGIAPKAPIPTSIRGEDRVWLRKFLEE